MPKQTWQKIANKVHCSEERNDRCKRKEENRISEKEKNKEGKSTQI